MMVQISTVQWDDLRLFLELVRRGSARAAAQVLGVSHSTVVRRIERLEASLDATLFDRDYTGYRPTVAGELLLDSAESAEDAILSADRRLRGRDARLTGSIRLTTSDLLAYYLLVAELPDFTDQYPDIDLSVLVSYDVFDLTRREADIAIRFYGNDGRPPDELIGRKLIRVANCYYASEDYLLQHDLSDPNSDARWIGWGDDERFPAWVLDSPFPHLPAFGHFNGGVLQAHAVKAGLGIAVLPCFVGDAIPGVVRIPGCEPYLNYDVWLLSHPDLRDTARYRAFREYLADVFARRRDVLLGGIAPDSR